MGSRTVMRFEAHGDEVPDANGSLVTHAAYAEMLTELESAQQRVASLERRRQTCPDCGQQWLDDGLTPGCSCHTIKKLEQRVVELEAENQRRRVLIWDALRLGIVNRPSYNAMSIHKDVYKALETEAAGAAKEKP